MSSRKTWLALGVAAFISVPVAAEPLIAIIIDDLGYRKSLGERAIALPGPVAYAVLPGTPNGAVLAQIAHRNGREVLLHLPLEAMNGEEPDEPGLLRLDMTRTSFAETVSSNLASVPHVSGINTHRGSLLTRHPGHMGWLMEEITDRGGLYFVDSYTTANSIALEIAGEHGVPALRRDVFLDPDPSPATVAREFSRLKSVADEQGFAIGIGHPYPATLEYLEQALPELESEGYTLVTVAELVYRPGVAASRPVVAGE
jgi:polysaccharide deacetylase 2 family uncharacterized protein YibQ